MIPQWKIFTSKQSIFNLAEGRLNFRISCGTREIRWYSKNVIYNKINILRLRFGVKILIFRRWVTLGSIFKGVSKRMNLTLGTWGSE